MQVPLQQSEANWQAPLWAAQATQTPLMLQAVPLQHSALELHLPLAAMQPHTPPVQVTPPQQSALVWQPAPATAQAHMPASQLPDESVGA